MSVKDMIKKSVLKSGVFDQYNISSILVVLVAALALGILIFLVYRRFYTGVIYSRTFQKLFWMNFMTENVLNIWKFLF